MLGLQRNKKASKPASKDSSNENKFKRAFGLGKQKTAVSTQEITESGDGQDHVFKNSGVAIIQTGQIYEQGNDARLIDQMRALEQGPVENLGNYFDRANCLLNGMIRADESDSAALRQQLANFACEKFIEGLRDEDVRLKMIHSPSLQGNQSLWSTYHEACKCSPKERYNEYTGGLESDAQNTLRSENVYEDDLQHDNSKQQQTRNQQLPVYHTASPSPEEISLEDGSDIVIAADVSQLSGGLTVIKSQNSQESFVLGQPDECYVRVEAPKMAVGRSDSLPSEMRSIADTDDITASTDVPQISLNRKAVPSMPLDKRRGLPLTPLEEAIQRRFWDEWKAQPLTFNKEKQMLISEAVKRLTTIAGEEHRRESVAVAPNDANGEELATSIDSTVEAKSNAGSENAKQLQHLLAWKKESSQRLEQKDQDLKSQAIRLRNLDSDLKSHREDLARSDAVRRRVGKELDRAIEEACSQRLRANDLETKLAKCEDGLQQLRHQHEKAIKEKTDFEKNYDKKIEHMEAYYKKDYDDKFRKRERTWRETDRELEQSRQKVKALESNHKIKVQEMKDLHTRDVRLKQESNAKAASEVKAAHNKEIQEMITRHRQQRDTQQRDYEDELEHMTREVEGVKKQAEIDMQRAKEEFTRQKRQAGVEHDGKVAELLQDKENSETRLTEKHNKEKARLEKEAILLKEAFHEEKDQLLKEYQMKADSLVAEHETEKQHVQRQVQELNAALLSRDEDEYRASAFQSSGLPRKPDEKLREIFGDVQHMVDDLSRITWKPNQKLWSERIIERSRGQTTTRVFKKAIVQDLIWSCLFQGVFGSAFRVFGEEGENLDREWFEQCKQGTSFESRPEINSA